jgi:hypothetical protein
MLGLGFLVGVAVLRAVSYHATDRILDTPVLGLSTGRLLEIAGLGLAGAGALRRARAA